jgi:hypothetical protein
MISSDGVNDQSSNDCLCKIIRNKPLKQLICETKKWID